MSLKGKKIIITGGGRGIGKAIALAFAKVGADVVITGRTKSEIEDTSKEIRWLGQQSLAIQSDVTNSDDVENVVNRTTETLGRIDILINNAGGSLENKSVVDSDSKLWIRTIEINLVGTYLFSKAVLPYMIKNKSGKIINIGSGMGHRASTSSTNSSYSAAKAGVWMFTQSLAMEVWKYGIDVNEIVPGPVETEATRQTFHVGQPVPFAESEIVKSPDEVALLAVYLASQPHGGPTGQYFSLARRLI
jgi:3-oxoacyl-[acyl-carrier protein] reductase